LPQRGCCRICALRAKLFLGTPWVWQSSIDSTLPVIRSIPRKRLITSNSRNFLWQSNANSKQRNSFRLKPISRITTRNTVAARTPREPAVLPNCRAYPAVRWLLLHHQIIEQYIFHHHLRPSLFCQETVDLRQSLLPHGFFSFNAAYGFIGLTAEQQHQCIANQRRMVINGRRSPGVIDPQ